MLGKTLTAMLVITIFAGMPFGVHATNTQVCSRDNAAACLDGVSTSVTALDNMRPSGQTDAKFATTDDGGWG